MNLLRDIPLRDSDGNLHVVVEVPKGSAVKLKYDPDLNLFMWSRGFSLGVSFPYDFGFLPRTLAEDDDGLDALVYTDVGSLPGVVVPARLIGALRVEQQRDGGPVKRNDRMLVVPANDHRNDHLTEVGELPARITDEMIEFFTASLALTGKQVKFCGWADRAEATAIVTAAEKRFRAAHP